MTTALRSDAQRTHERILHAATAELAVNPSAGMDAIAQRAEIGRATLYRHFATRDDLVAALRERFFDRIEDAAAASIAETDPRTAVLVFIESVTRAVTESCTMDEGTPPSDTGAERAMAAIRQAIAALVERGTATGRLQDGVDAEWVFTVGKALIDAGAREIALGADVDVVAPRVAETTANALVR